MNLLPAASRAKTPLAFLIARLRERGATRDGEERPAAILWTDRGGEWSRILDPLLDRLPELLVLGDQYQPPRTGPAIWLRCMVDRVLDGALSSAPWIPILYLPGVGRQDLRAGEDCPDRLKPIVELLHRGVAWHHPNGRDWTATAFLGSPEGVGLELASDGRTAASLREALGEVALTKLTQFRGRRLEADDFDRLMVDDLPRNLLRWLGEPHETRSRLADRWTAFRNRCRDELEFDPETGSDLIAGRQLAEAAGSWAAVWGRYADAPQAFPGVESLLRRCQPQGQLLRADPARWPNDNDRLENALRGALRKLPHLPHPRACDEVAALEAQHGKRRTWVWSRLDQTPLADALEPLSRLAAAVRSPLGGNTPDDVAAAYRERGWQADAAGWEALAGLGVSEENLVAAAVRHLLEPWLEDSARAFQDAVRRHPLPGPGGEPVVTAAADGCLLFVDGLRYDLAQRLVRQLEERGFRARVNTRWAALPTVTATAKPAVSPVAGAIEGEALGADFAPHFVGGARLVNAQRLRDAMEGQGYQILGRGAFDAPRGAASRGWAETGTIDKTGHKEQDGLPRRLPEELDRLAGRIIGLVKAGWRSVRIVTDHGWLFLPGGLPKVALPKHLTESRWARCAVLSGSAAAGVPCGPWHWNASQEFATAPGIGCFNTSDPFAHGGLSIQECLTPDILVEREPGAAPVSIESVTWVRFRCHLVVSGGREGLTADLLLGDPAGDSVAQSPKRIDPDGSASLVLADDEHEGGALVVVIRDESGRVLAFQETRVGVNS